MTAEARVELIYGQGYLDPGPGAFIHEIHVVLAAQLDECLEVEGVLKVYNAVASQRLTLPLVDFLEYHPLLDCLDQKLAEAEHLQGVTRQEEHGWDENLLCTRFKLWEEAVGMMLRYLSPLP